MEYYAHSSEDGTRLQTVAEHLKGTAEKCRAFAAEFGAESIGSLMGNVHDVGKCTEEFQNRLLNDGPKVDHSTAGAVLCAYLGQLWAAECVAGHHGGLPDFGNLRLNRPGEGTLCGRLKKGKDRIREILECCVQIGLHLPANVPDLAPKDKLQISYWTRVLYSCLVDADFLDTELFMQGDRGRGGSDDLQTLLARLEKYIEPWQNPQTKLNRLRCEILNTCLAAGEKPRGVYTLTVPTGGGKTVASLGFALRHAVHHGMKRIVYVIPYTSIIDQNAAVFRSILGDGNVLEHHSGVDIELSDGAKPEEIRKALATENWDMPVVVTTAAV